MLVPLAPRLLLLVLVSLQTHSTLFLVLALGLVNTFIVIFRKYDNYVIYFS